MKASLISWIFSLVLLVVGVLTLLLVWKNVYQPQVEENKKLKADIQVLEVSLATQSKYKKDENKYKAEAEKLQGEAEEILKAYPIDLWEEDHIAYADYISKKTDMKITSLNWAQGGAVKTLSNGRALTSESVTFNYSRSYASLKELIQFLVNDPLNHSSLTTLSISYNAKDDVISGTMHVNRFYLTNAGAAHTPAAPDGDIDVGQDNILD